MDEDTTTLTDILETQRAVNARLGPEAKISFAMGHTLGQLALKEQIEDLETGLAKWHHEATHDDLTEALNKTGLQEYLESAEAPRAVLWVDATNFKAINDKYGQDIGDRFIKKTFEKISESLRSGDVIARYGGDEFVILLNDDDSKPVPPGHPMANEYRPREMNSIEHIDAAKERIAEKVQELLENPEVEDNTGTIIDLKTINFDLAAGGAVWEGDVSIQQFIELARKAEAEAKAHKEEQHKSGQYRGP